MKKISCCACAALLLAGCQYNDNAPLIFGSATTFGVSVGAAAAGTSPELTVGFREARYMSAPTIARDNVSPTSDVALLTSTSDSQHLPGGEEDTFSTYAAFGSAAGSPSTTIDTVFATGPAARIAACRDNGRYKSCSAPR